MPRASARHILVSSEAKCNELKAAIEAGADFAQVGPLAIVGNNAFRLIKRLTPGPWTFILKGTKDVPRMTLNPKKHTLGVRIPDHAITQSLVAEFGAAQHGL